jgi:hypothetical protein
VRLLRENVEFHWCRDCWTRWPSRDEPTQAPEYTPHAPDEKEPLAAQRTGMDSPPSLPPASAPACPSCGHAGRLLFHRGWEDYHCESCKTTWAMDSRHPQPVPVILRTAKKDERKAVHYCHDAGHSLP